MSNFWCHPDPRKTAILPSIFSEALFVTHKKQNEPGTIANPRPVSDYTATEIEAWITVPSNASNAPSKPFSVSVRCS